MYTERARSKVVVGAAILSGGRVLACARSAPPEVAGRFEFPGGKVEPGESEIDAVARECAEELGITVRPGARLGVDVPLGNGWAVLRVYLAELIGDAQPRALEHRELRWLAVDELDSVLWLPADVPIVEALRAHLTAAG
ncbi:(deoxy)nucleoside triphosphate pyrophosphohydrolase [Catenuloplanes indicus]|uniref:8-oxo-dGTP diphosphatase n=1 Tax=Catenuloplanes indicus TaxID=137267 RepID=A0AAE3W3A0_9ACTN|nr:(deoxy)nucleoside triphosphate pyrophosphohydrolase [Catenuloplanes indicus]MDQ0368561.1 8-oxo-dGTP diphosphatase [Catenuloplanes indicus]